MGTKYEFEYENIAQFKRFSTYIINLNYIKNIIQVIFDLPYVQDKRVGYIGKLPILVFGLGTLDLSLKFEIFNCYTY